MGLAAIVWSMSCIFIEMNCILNISSQLVHDSFSVICRQPATKKKVVRWWSLILLQTNASSHLKQISEVPLSLQQFITKSLVKVNNEKIAEPSLILEPLYNLVG